MANKKSRKEVDALTSAIGVIGSVIGSIVELVKDLAGSLEPIYRLATPDGAVTLRKVAVIVIEDWKGVVVVTTYKVADCFRSALFAPNGRDGDLDRWLPAELPKLPPGRPKSLVTKQDETFREMFERELDIVGQGKTDAEIQKLLVEKQKCFSLEQIDEAVANGYVGDDKSLVLPNDGRASFFPMEGANGAVFVVCVRRDSDGWFVYVYRFALSNWWLAGLHSFFRN